MIISNTPGIIADIGGSDVIACRTNFFAFYFGVWIIPVVFYTYLVFSVDDVLQQIEEGTIEFPYIIRSGEQQTGRLRISGRCRLCTPPVFASQFSKAPIVFKRPLHIRPTVFTGRFAVKIVFG